ncbi:IPT/TIG domain-containing protein [Streptomyces decoyicus]|uniref:IPT/TIG domain-containing protein n=1 Tax=Streptomyces decoyicus TaxID=249567 RepID=UPI00398CDA5A
MSWRSGPQAGGTLVTLTGTSLSGATAVRFGTTPAVITANQIIVVTPPGVGVAPATVTTPGGTSNPKPFVYYPRGDASSMAPSAGPTAGRNAITIRGDQLATASQVLFGSVPTLPIVVSDSRLDVPVPPGVAAGCVPLTVTTDGGLATGTLSYRYVAPPVPGVLKPTTGSVFGGNVITISGQNLATTAMVRKDRQSDNLVPIDDDVPVCPAGRRRAPWTGREGSLAAICARSPTAAWPAVAPLPGTFCRIQGPGGAVDPL